MKPTKMAICIPSHGEWKYEFGMSVSLLLGAIGHRPPMDNFAINILCEKGSILPSQRTGLVNAALKWDADYVLFVDDDMVFPAWAAHRLIRSGKDIIAANCPKKQIPSDWTAKKDGQFYASTGKQGVEEVDSVGTGLMLVKADVFRNVEKPWFMLGYNQETEGYTGEDVWFCNAAKKAGYSIHIEHDVSKEMQHIGSFNYTCEAEYSVE